MASRQHRRATASRTTPSGLPCGNQAFQQSGDAFAYFAGWFMTAGRAPGGSVSRTLRCSPHSALARHSHSGVHRRWPAPPQLWRRGMEIEEWCGTASCGKGGRSAVCYFGQARGSAVESPMMRGAGRTHGVWCLLRLRCGALVGKLKGVL